MAHPTRAALLLLAPLLLAAADEGPSSAMSCGLRSHVDVSQCSQKASWSMYLLDPARRSWTERAGLACWPGHGAQRLPGRNSSDDTLTLAACKQRCLERPACTAIEFGQKPGGGGGAGSACAPHDLQPPSGRKAHPNQMFGPPALDKASVSAWLSRMRSMRTACRRSLNLSDAAARVPELEWTQTAYYQPQMHPFDRFFFDPAL